MPCSAPATSAAPPLGLDTVQIAQVLGVQGKANAGVYQVSVPRAGSVTLDGVEVPPAIGAIC